MEKCIGVWGNVGGGVGKCVGCGESKKRCGEKSRGCGEVC